MTLKSRIRMVEPTTRYILRSRAAISYVGWLGNHNLGDEATYEATQTCFSTPVIWRPDKLQPRFSSRRADPRLLLGGGTLIGGRFLPIMTQARPACQAVFGTGVIDPEYPHSYGDDVDGLEKWCEHLADVKHVGVRGPRSQELLRDRGIEATVIGDPIAQFVVDQPRTNPSGPIGVNVGHSFGRMWGSEYRFLAEMVDAMALLKARGIPVEYFVVWPSDLPITRAVAAQSGTQDAPIHKVYDSAADLIRLTARWRGVIALKLHAAALSVCCGLPTIALEYHPKSRDFMRSVDLEANIVRTDQINAHDLVERFIATEDASTNRDALSTLASFASLQSDWARAISMTLGV